MQTRNSTPAIPLANGAIGSAVDASSLAAWMVPPVVVPALMALLVLAYAWLR